MRPKLIEMPTAYAYAASSCTLPVEVISCLSCKCNGNSLMAYCWRNNYGQATLTPVGSRSSSRVSLFERLK